VLIGSAITAGNLIVDQFRFHGAAGPLDEYVDIYNATALRHTVLTTDGSAGYALVGSDGVTRFVIPTGTEIPARGHFLIVNNTPGTGFSLGGYPAGVSGVGIGDGQYTLDIPDGGGVALFSSAATLDMTTRLDAVGFSGAPALYLESAGLAPTGGITVDGEYAFLRNRETGTPKDTNVNQDDFDFVATTAGSFGTRASMLGAPGPESLASPIARSATTEIVESTIDASVGAAVSPNTLRTPSATGPNAPLGTLEFRRRYTNNTGAAVTRLRFRVVAMTTVGSAVVLSPPQAILKLLSSTDLSVSTSGGPVLTKGLTIEEPPTQSLGGGKGTTVTCDFPSGRK
jgi:hypothetical protein